MSVRSPNWDLHQNKPNAHSLTSRPISAKPGWVLKKNKVRELLNPIDHAEGEKKWLEQEEHFQFLKLPPKKQEAILKQKVR